MKGRQEARVKKKKKPQWEQTARTRMGIKKRKDPEIGEMFERGGTEMLMRLVIV